MTITGTNFRHGSDGDVREAAATNVVVVNSTTITATTPAGQAGAVTVTVNGERAERKPDATGSPTLVPPTVSSVTPNSGSDGGRDGGDDHRDELCGGSDGDVRECGGDERSGGEQHDDHGDNAGGQRGRGDGDGDQRQGRRAGA